MMRKFSEQYATRCVILILHSLFLNHTSTASSSFGQKQHRLLRGQVSDTILQMNECLAPTFSFPFVEFVPSKSVFGCNAGAWLRLSSRVWLSTKIHWAPLYAHADTMMTRRQRLHKATGTAHACPWGSERYDILTNWSIHFASPVTW